MIQKVPLGEDSISVTPLAFGAWAIGGWLWGGSNEKESVDAIEAAIDHGMTTIDTAPVYGFGQSEEWIGKAVKGKREKIQILTKFGLRWDTRTTNLHFEKTKDNTGKELSIYRHGGKESIIRECENSLRRMGTHYIDLYQQHWPDTHTPVEETMEALEILKTQGKIRAGGVSNYSAGQMAEADKYFNLASNQVSYSMVNRDIEKALLPWCRDNSKAIIVYSPLQRGILTGKISQGYKFNEGDHRPENIYFKEPNLSKINHFLKIIKPIADQKHSTLAQLVISWTLAQPGITCVLVGARNRQQVLENVAASKLEITSDEMEFINNKLNNLHLALEQ
jgi:aryl-alcohol dehydrogenase-like predicted oxidoreductase